MGRRSLQVYFLITAVLLAVFLALDHFHAPSWMGWSVVVTLFVLTLARLAKDRGWFR
jgi:hypothetical protein